MSSAAPLQTLGKYHLIAELGHGGMADVFLAVAQGPAGFSKLQVVKQLRPSLAENPEIVTMFLDEARLAARLNHPNVVQTYEVEQEGDHCFIAMEYLEGQPLDRILRRSKKKGGLPLPLHLRILSDTLAGLHHAHELCDYDGTPLRVVHRDVSPQNIFVTYEGQIKVVDFGIAKAANGSAETRTGVLKGKISYMSPEQAVGGDLDRRSDLFAVGVLLFEAISGDKFWKNTTDIQILHRLSNGLLPSIADLPPDTPETLRQLCARAIALEPEERFATAEEFHNAIEGYLKTIGLPSGRDVGGHIIKLFEDRRYQARAIVDEQLRILRNQEPPPGVRPNLFNQTLTLTAARPGEQTSSVNTSTPVASETEVPPARRPLWPLALVALGAAVLGAFALRSWSESAAPPRASAPATSGAAAPRTIELRLGAEPASASFFLDDAPLPGNPFVGRFPRDDASHRLRVEASGHAPQTLLVRLEEDQKLTLKLTPEPGPSASAAAKPEPPPADDRKDPRGGARPAKAAAPPPAAAPTDAPPPDDLPAPPTKKKPLREIDKDDPWKLRASPRLSDPRAAFIRSETHG
jgi:serine/threonine protein kinase